VWLASVDRARDKMKESMDTVAELECHEKQVQGTVVPLRSEGILHQAKLDYLEQITLMHQHEEFHSVKSHGCQRFKLET